MYPPPPKKKKLQTLELIIWIISLFPIWARVFSNELHLSSFAKVALHSTSNYQKSKRNHLEELIEAVNDFSEYCIIYSSQTPFTNLKYPSRWFKTMSWPTDRIFANPTSIWSTNITYWHLLRNRKKKYLQISLELKIRGQRGNELFFVWLWEAKFIPRYV